ncbi:hypothetical protein RND71_010870 [Anisodus tanguticus]|uniref:Reverse transcriptase domain-containing protein n=1 Tax=Anisodus tanguticus TaxID=243964 RepID=A0AAE1VT17_9SOLA|nr:hypothetical protein RND71_010870 [Anisodus tanguticus]
MILIVRKTTLQFAPKITLFPLPRLHLSTLSPFNQNPTKTLSQLDIKNLILSHYHHNKFHNLLQNVIALPSFLFTACHNLKPNDKTTLTPKTVSTHYFSIQELSSQLITNQFDVKDCTFIIGKSLVLPNLKLKVVLESIRMVLETIYDDRFMTFCYGGRVNMGRHTMIRYLKNNVENPSWWFTVCLNPSKFENKHVDKLCRVMEEKISDVALIGLVKRLFECEIVSIRLGGCYLGRGLPQECRLSMILINIYFNSFDKEIQELRLKTNRENPRVDANEVDNAFYKPLKIYAVRYLDEILVITSGTKIMTLDLKSRLVQNVEKNMEFGIDKVKTVIHSATSEKIEFLGMELQAVKPSVLHPPMSQKAIRARKKYFRQKEVRLLELKNAKETNRKKLGMKIFSHVFKKMKRGNGFKTDFPIESEVKVNQIFNSWAKELMRDFLESVDDRWEWHRMLSAGDFLSLKRIRDQLPGELVDAYDNFQEQVDRYLNPVKAKRVLEEQVKIAEEEEERKYSDQTVADLTKLCIKVEAPLETVKKAVKLVGFTNHMGRPRPISLLMALEDTDIIKWYAGIGRRWLDYFCCCHNFKKLKIIVSYHLRFSCILTLAEKHESTKREAIRHYTKDLKVFDINGVEEVNFPTEREVKMMGDNDLVDPKPVDSSLGMALIRLASDEPSYRCAAHFCDRRDTIVYRIRLLQNILNLDPFDRSKWVPGMGAIHENLNKRCIPLCSDHISEIYLGRLTLQDTDYTSILHVD